MKAAFPFHNVFLVLGLLAAATPLYPKTIAAETRLTIRVLDYANLSDDVRSELEANAGRILAQAGVPADFVECPVGKMEAPPADCEAQRGPTEFLLRLLPPQFAATSRQLGYAVMTSEGGAYLTVFADPERRKTRMAGLSEGVLLGHATAHEVGHLLLGADSHSLSGIMRPRWRLCDEDWMLKGVLLFDSDQAKKMQAELLVLADRPTD